MATQAKLRAQRREGSGKGQARKIRAAGMLPAVVYGAGEASLPVVLNYHEAETLFHSISVDNTIVNLEVEGEKTPVPTLVREIQTHPFKPDILHVDFYRIQTGVEVELDVPIHLSGTPTGVKDEGGVLQQVIHDLPVRCVPADIPEEILVDVTGLAIGESVHVSELALPEGVTVTLDGERTVCSVQVPTELVVEEEVAAEEEEPEVVGAEEEGEEAPEAAASEDEEEGEED